MSANQPANTSVSDICTAALRISGAIGKNEVPSGGQISEAQTYLQWLLQEWQEKRWLVYHLVTLSVTSTGALSYSIGPGGDLDTGLGSVRPIKIASAFLRQLTNSAPNQVDYPLQILQSREDYNKIALKSLASFPGTIFLDTDWPLGHIFAWPVPQANIYALHVSVMCALPQSFDTTATKFTIPYVYYWPMVTNLGLRLRVPYQIGTYPGDTLPRAAKDSLGTLRGANTQIAELVLPNLGRSYLYNIFSDRFY